MVNCHRGLNRKWMVNRSVWVQMCGIKCLILKSDKSNRSQLNGSRRRHWTMLTAVDGLAPNQFSAMASPSFFSTSFCMRHLRKSSFWNLSKWLLQSILYQFAGGCSRKPSCLATFTCSSMNLCIVRANMAKVAAISNRSSQQPGSQAKLNLLGSLIIGPKPSVQVNWKPSCLY